MFKILLKMKIISILLSSSFLLHFCLAFRVNVEEGNNGLFDDLLRNIRSIIEDEPIVNHKITLSSTENLDEKENLLKEKSFSKENFNTTSDFIREERELKPNADTSSDVACTVKSDCNATSYCDKLSYTCLPCSGEQEHCTHDRECCSGHYCNAEKRKCEKRKGQNGDKCESFDDCLRDHCCALSNNGDGVCRPYLKEGEDCSADNLTPFFFFPSASFEETTNGLPNKCPCNPGLHCKRRESFFFFESEKCSKPVSNHHIRKHKINLKRPSFHYHTESEIPLNLPEEFTEKQEIPLNLPEEFTEKDDGLTKTFTQTQMSGPITIHRVYKIFRYPLNKRKTVSKHHKKHHFFLTDLLKHSLPENDSVAKVPVKILDRNKFENITLSNNTVNQTEKIPVQKNQSDSIEQDKENDVIHERGFKLFDNIFNSIMRGFVKSFNFSP